MSWNERAFRIGRVEEANMPPREVVSKFVQRAGTFEGTPVQSILHEQRLARRMATEHQHRFSADDLISAARLLMARPRTYHSE